MENKKDKAMVVVISGLTSNQAGQLTKEFTNRKKIYSFFCGKLHRWENGSKNS